MPITILVVDEFAEIKKNLPEFVPVLESLFAVGRSLGIFAVVSTQKPSGVVTDKMYANSKFRWCCRVASSADSKEMLRHADAAKFQMQGVHMFKSVKTTYMNRYNLFGVAHHMNQTEKKE